MAYVPSLLVADGLLYMVEDSGNAPCFDAATGAEVWRAKLERPIQLLAAPGRRPHLRRQRGRRNLRVQGRPALELVAKNDLADGGFATPVICAGRIYLRTLHRLYCLATERKQP